MDRPRRGVQDPAAYRHGGRAPQAPSAPDITRTAAPATRTASPCTDVSIREGRPIASPWRIAPAGASPRAARSAASVAAALPVAGSS